MKPLTTTPESKATDWAPSLDAYEPSLSHAALACARFVADMERGTHPYWLTLQGVNGCGKTMLLKQVLEEARRINPGNPRNNAIWPPDWKQFDPDSVNIYTDRRPYCLDFTEARMAQRMRDGDYHFPANARNDFFVALDEIGVARDPTNFVAEAVGALCEARIGRWSMFATNLSLQEIAERMDARISSRLVRDDNVFLKIRARDYALRMSQPNLPTPK